MNEIDNMLLAQFITAVENVQSLTVYRNKTLYEFIITAIETVYNDSVMSDLVKRTLCEKLIDKIGN